MLLITDLNIDELVIIFAYCTEIDHKNLSRTCRLFERIVEEHFYEKRCRNCLMISHVKNYPELFERTINNNIKYGERLKIGQNWSFGTCQQVIFFQHRENYETLLEMDGNYLYTAALGTFSIYSRKLKNALETKPFFTTGSENSSKISSLKRRGNRTAGSKLNGTIFTYDESGYSEELLKVNSRQQILDMDFFDDTFIACTSNDLSFHHISTELGLQTFDFDKSLSVGFSSANFSPSGEKILGIKSDSLHLLDPKVPIITHSYLNRSQVFNSQWLDSNSFAFCSKNSPLTLIDARSMDFRRSEFSCGNFTATCVNYDGRYGLIYGTLLGMMVLCDLRNLRTFERVFHLDISTVCRHIVSDEAHLYVSTDNSIHLLNFNF